MKPNGGEIVLVTAASGGTGQFAVQLAKLAGNHVIGTCSSDDKIEFLKKLGCDRAINVTKENLDAVLKKEYRSGVNIVYESVGGEVFEACANNLAMFGRLIVIGFTSGYLSGAAWTGEGLPTNNPLPTRLLARSSSVKGFFLHHYKTLWPAHAARLLSLCKEGKIKSNLESTQFIGLEQVADAVEFLHQRKHKGKIIVDISPTALKSKL